MKESKRRNVPALTKSFHTSSNDFYLERKDWNDSSSENRMFPSLFILFSVFELARFLTKKSRKCAGEKVPFQGSWHDRIQKPFFTSLIAMIYPHFIAKIQSTWIE